MPRLTLTVEDPQCLQELVDPEIFLSDIPAVHDGCFRLHDGLIYWLKISSRIWEYLMNKVGIQD
jgi:hypothetical protein